MYHPSIPRLPLTHAPTLLCALLMLIVLLITGCGGGGGTSIAGGGPDPVIVDIGGVKFSPSSSRNFSSHSLSFDMSQVWHYHREQYDPETESKWLEDVPTNQSFGPSTLTISSGSISVELPCYKVTYALPGPNAWVYEWWATSTDGSLYRLSRTDYESSVIVPGNTDANGADLLPVPKKILPCTITMGESWSEVSLTGATHGTYVGIESVRVFTIDGVGVTSPRGWPNCVRIRVTSSVDYNGDGGSWQDVFEYWSPDFGLVEQSVNNPGQPDDKTGYYRVDASASG